MKLHCSDWGGVGNHSLSFDVNYQPLDDLQTSVIVTILLCHLCMLPNWFLPIVPRQYPGKNNPQVLQVHACKILTRKMSVFLQVLQDSCKCIVHALHADLARNLQDLHTSCKVLAGARLLYENCTKNVPFLASYLQVTCTSCKNLALHFPLGNNLWHLIVNIPKFQNILMRKIQKFKSLTESI